MCILKGFNPNKKELERNEWWNFLEESKEGGASDVNKQEEEKTEKDKEKSEEEKDKDFALKGLKAHNKLRKIHKVPDFKLNETMSKEAKEYAKKLAGAQEYTDSGTDDGENIALGCSEKEDDEISGVDAAEHWYLTLFHFKRLFMQCIVYNKCGQTVIYYFNFPKYAKRTYYIKSEKKTE